MAEELRPNAFAGHTTAPSDAELSVALGAARPLWDQALQTLAARFQLADAEWNSYSPKAGWSLRVRKGKRNIVYLTPCQGCFRATFILGGKAVAAAREAASPARVLKLIDTGTQYPEGLGIRWEVKSARDLSPLAEFTRWKLAF